MGLMVKNAIILAGGLGTRLRPVTHEIPKPLVPVQKKPILSHFVTFLEQYGVERVAVIAAARDRDDFDKWARQENESRSKACIEIFYEEEPSGTFGWLRNLRDWIGSEPFFFANGDSLMDFDLHTLQKLHMTHRPVVSAALVRIEKPYECDRPVLENNVVVDIDSSREPKGTNDEVGFVNIGFYLAEPALLDYDDLSRKFLITEKDIFPRIIADRKLMAFEMDPGRFYDCGTLERWERAIKEW